MSLYGAQFNANLKKLQIQIRLQLSKFKLHPNIHSIVRSFEKFDNKGLIDNVNFEKALNENKLFYKKYQIQVFEKAYSNQERKIQWRLFIEELLEPINQRRKNIVLSIFNSIAGANKTIKKQELQQLVLDESVKHQFQIYFKNQINEIDFLNYYQGVSLSFSHDELFQKLLCDTWKVQYSKNNQVNKKQVSAAIKALRYKLIQKTKGTNDQFLLHKIFAEFDENKNGYISQDQLDLMLKRLGLPTQQKIVNGMFIQLDKNNSGYLQESQFRHFLFFDPYPI